MALLSRFDVLCIFVRDGGGTSIFASRYRHFVLLIGVSCSAVASAMLAAAGFGPRFDEGASLYNFFNGEM